MTMTCTVHPILALAAIRRHAAAWQAWVVARALDVEGSGRVNPGALLAKLNELLGGDFRAAQYRTKKAIEAGFLWFGGGVVSYASPKRIAEMVGAQAWDKRRVEIHLEALFEKGKWRQAIYAAALVEVANPSKPISRFTISKITGVNRRRQVRLEKDNGRIRKTANVVATGLDTSYLLGLWENEGYQFLAVGGRVYRRIGNTYTVVDENIKRGTKGRCKKTRTEGLFDVEQATDVRYYNDQRDAERRARKDNCVVYFSAGENAASYQIWREVR